MDIFCWIVCFWLIDWLINWFLTSTLGVFQLYLFFDVRCGWFARSYRYLCIRYEQKKADCTCLVMIVSFYHECLHVSFLGDVSFTMYVWGKIWILELNIYLFLVWLSTFRPVNNWRIFTKKVSHECIQYIYNLHSRKWFQFYKVYWT